jgi:hypothetical protein
MSCVRYAFQINDGSIKPCFSWVALENFLFVWLLSGNMLPLLRHQKDAEMTCDDTIHFVKQKITLVRRAVTTTDDG